MFLFCIDEVRTTKQALHPFIKAEQTLVFFMTIKMKLAKLAKRYCKYDDDDDDDEEKKTHRNENKSGNKLTTISQSHFDCYRVPWPDSRIYYALFYLVSTIPFFKECATIYSVWCFDSVRPTHCWYMFSFAFPPRVCALMLWLSVRCDSILSLNNNNSSKIYSSLNFIVYISLCTVVRLLVVRFEWSARFFFHREIVFNIFRLSDA